MDKKDLSYYFSTVRWMSSCTKGILIGGLKPEVYEVMHKLENPPEIRMVNPPKRVLLAQMQARLENYQTSTGQKRDYSDKAVWRILPWQKDKPYVAEMHRLWGGVIAYTDDYKATPPHEFFPIPQMLQYIEAVFAESEQANRALTLPEQFAIALEIAEGYPTAAAILAQFASRAVARNHDHHVSDQLKFPIPAMERWSKSIADFDETPNYDPLGDTYHLWGHISVGMLLQTYNDENTIQVGLYRVFFHHGADFMKFARTVIVRRPISIDHRQIDRMGLAIGKELAEQNLE